MHISSYGALWSPTYATLPYFSATFSNGANAYFPGGVTQLSPGNTVAVVESFSFAHYGYQKFNDVAQVTSELSVTRSSAPSTLIPNKLYPHPVLPSTVISITHSQTQSSSSIPSVTGSGYIDCIDMSSSVGSRVWSYAVGTTISPYSILDSSISGNFLYLLVQQFPTAGNPVTVVELIKWNILTQAVVFQRGVDSTISWNGAKVGVGATAVSVTFTHPAGFDYVTFDAQTGTTLTSGSILDPNINFYGDFISLIPAGQVLYGTYRGFISSTPTLNLIKVDTTLVKPSPTTHIAILPNNPSYPNLVLVGNQLLVGFANVVAPPQEILGLIMLDTTGAFSYSNIQGRSIAPFFNGAPRTDRGSFSPTALDASLPYGLLKIPTVPFTATGSHGTGPVDGNITFGHLSGYPTPILDNSGAVVVQSTVPISQYPNSSFVNGPSFPMMVTNIIT